MEKMKRYFLYIVLLIALALISEFLIAVGLNSTYKQMEKDENSNIEQIEIYQEESTKVNGRIRGMIKNSEENPITQKYIKFSFYTERGINMGSRYIEIDKETQMQPFELFFKLNNVKKYTMTLVNEKEPTEEIEIMPKDLTKPEIILGTAFALLLFM